MATSYEESGPDETARVKFQCVVKGLYECLFEVEDGETYIVQRKYGERGRAFLVYNLKGRLGHIQKELVNILWNLENHVSMEG